MIYSANQLTGFYMMTTLAFNELIWNKWTDLDIYRRLPHCIKDNCFIKDFFSKCALIDSVDLVTSTHLLRKSLMENFIFCAVYLSVFKSLTEQKLDNFCHEIVQRGILLPYFLILQKFELKVSFKWWLRDPGLAGGNFNLSSQVIFHTTITWRKSDFILVRWDSFSSGICLHLFTFFLVFFCKHALSYFFIPPWKMRRLYGKISSGRSGIPAVQMRNPASPG